MPSVTAGQLPELERHLKSLKGQPLETSIQNLVSYVSFCFACFVAYSLSLILLGSPGCSKEGKSEGPSLAPLLPPISCSKSLPSPGGMMSMPCS